MYIEKHISNLKQYIKDDEIIEKDGSDFANFCKGHIDDIQAVLNELEKKDRQIEASNQEHKYDVKMIDEVKGEAVKLYKEIREKDKVIDLMAEQLTGLAIFDIEKEEPLILGDKEEVKQYFYKKAEEK